MGVLVGMFFCPSRLGVISRKEYVSDTTVFGGAREDRERERERRFGARFIFVERRTKIACYFLSGEGIHRRRRRRHGRVSWEQ